MNDNDELQIYRGRDYIINDKITIHQPTLNEICDFGEEKYFSFISTMTAIPVDYILQLENIGIKYEDLSDFDMFIMTAKSIQQNDSCLLFGDIDFSKFELFKNNENQQVVLIDKENDIIIDRYIYTLIVDYIRKANNIKRNNVICGNKAMRNYLLMKAEKRLKNKQSFRSVLKPLISAMINTKEFKYGHNEVWNMKINAFMDSIQRIQLIKNFEQTMQGIYAGNLDVKKISKSQLNWLKELD